MGLSLGVLEIRRPYARYFRPVVSALVQAGAHPLDRMPTRQSFQSPSLFETTAAVTAVCAASIDSVPGRDRHASLRRPKRPEHGPRCPDEAQRKASTPPLLIREYAYPASS